MVLKRYPKSLLYVVLDEMDTDEVETDPPLNAPDNVPEELVSPFAIGDVLRWWCKPRRGKKVLLKAYTA